MNVMHVDMIDIAFQRGAYSSGYVCVCLCVCVYA